MAVLKKHIKQLDKIAIIPLKGAYTINRKDIPHKSDGVEKEKSS